MLIIDNREGKLIELIKGTPSFTIPYELKNLQLGDIIVSSEKCPEKSIVIERKCVADMLASIKDGRYKEQKLRLQAEKANSNRKTLICYLVEGSLQDVRYPTEKKVFHGSIVSSIFRDEIPLIRTSNINETLDIIIRIHERMAKDITDFFKPCENNITTTTNPITNDTNTTITTDTITTNTNTSNTTDTNTSNTTDTNTENTPNTEITNINDNSQIHNSYLNSIKKCKKENLTPQIWNQISLTNIPGVSTSIATKISEVYPTLKQLFQAYDNCETDSY